MAQKRPHTHSETNSDEQSGRPAWLIWAGTVVLIAMIVIAGCTAPGGDSAPAQSDTDNTPDEISAPNFTFSIYQGADALGVSGDEAEFKALFGQGKPVVLNLWAGLCPPCRAEMPDFQAVYDQKGDEFVMLGLDIGPFVNLGTRDDGRALLNELGVEYPAATTSDSSIISKYKVRGMPTTVFLTADGEIYETHTGLLNAEALRQKVDEVRAASSEG